MDSFSLRVRILAFLYMLHYGRRGMGGIKRLWKIYIVIWVMLIKCLRFGCRLCCLKKWQPPSEGWVKVNFDAHLGLDFYRGLRVVLGVRVESCSQLGLEGWRIIGMSKRLKQQRLAMVWSWLCIWVMRRLF